MGDSIVYCIARSHISIDFSCGCAFLKIKYEAYHESACQVSYRRVLMTKNQPVVSYKRVLTVL